MAYNSSSKQIKVIKPKKSAGRLMYSEAQRLQDPQAKSGKILDSRVINALEDDLAVLIKDSNYQYKKILLDEIYTLLTNINVLTADNSSSFAQELADLASENILSSLKSLSDKSPSASTIYETLKDGLKSNSSVLSELKSLLKETYDKLNSVSSKIVEAFNSSSPSKTSSTNLNKQTFSSFAKFIHKTTLANTAAIKELINTKFEDNSKWLNAKFLRTYTRIARVEDTLGSTNEKIDKSLKELSEIALDVRKIKTKVSKSLAYSRMSSAAGTGLSFASGLLPFGGSIIKTTVKDQQKTEEKTSKLRSMITSIFKDTNVIKTAAVGTFKKITTLGKTVDKVYKKQEDFSEEYKKDKQPKSKMLAFIKFLTSPYGAVVLGFLWGFFKTIILNAIGNIKEKIEKFMDFLKLDGTTKEEIIKNFLQQRLGLDIDALKKDFLYVKDAIGKLKTADIEKIITDVNSLFASWKSGYDEVKKFLQENTNLIDFIKKAITTAIKNYITIKIGAEVGKRAIDTLMFGGSNKRFRTSTFSRAGRMMARGGSAVLGAFGITGLVAAAAYLVYDLTTDWLEKESKKRFNISSDANELNVANQYTKIYEASQTKANSIFSSMTNAESKIIEDFNSGKVIASKSYKNWINGHIHLVISSLGKAILLNNISTKKELMPYIEQYVKDLLVFMDIPITPNNIAKEADNLYNTIDDQYKALYKKSFIDFVLDNKNDITSNVDKANMGAFLKYSLDEYLKNNKGPKPGWTLSMGQDLWTHSDRANDLREALSHNDRVQSIQFLKAFGTQEARRAAEVETARYNARTFYDNLSNQVFFRIRESNIGNLAPNILKTAYDAAIAAENKIEKDLERLNQVADDMNDPRDPKYLEVRELILNLTERLYEVQNAQDNLQNLIDKRYKQMERDAKDAEQKIKADSKESRSQISIFNLPPPTRLIDPPVVSERSSSSYLYPYAL